MNIRIPTSLAVVVFAVGIATFGTSLHYAAQVQTESILITDITVTPTAPQIGEPFTISFTLTNVDTRMLYDLVIRHELMGPFGPMSAGSGEFAPVGFPLQQNATGTFDFSVPAGGVIQGGGYQIKICAVVQVYEGPGLHLESYQCRGKAFTVGSSNAQTSSAAAEGETRSSAGNTTESYSSGQAQPTYDPSMDGLSRDRIIEAIRKNNNHSVCINGTQWTGITENCVGIIHTPEQYGLQSTKPHPGNAQTNPALQNSASSKIYQAAPTGDSAKILKKLQKKLVLVEKKIVKLEKKIAQNQLILERTTDVANQKLLLQKLDKMDDQLSALEDRQSSLEEQITELEE